MQIYMPVKIFRGESCVKRNASELILGRRAVVITGKASGRVSGALDDVADVLDYYGVKYKVYDCVENNPTLEGVYHAGAFARSFGADFIIGIGGGSPLDAAKAAAVFAVNDICPQDIFKGEYPAAPLPIAAIPTTAGTGSEVTQYSILTLKDEQNKRSFTSAGVFPRVAFLDARYTQSLPRRVAADTAADALSHCIEGYVSRRSAQYSDMFALNGIALIGQQIDNLIEGSLDFEQRDSLLYASTLGGITIAHTGTTIVHSMGYMLTYHECLPHGRANGVLLPEFLKFNYDYAKEKIDKIMAAMNLSCLDEFAEMMKRLTPCEIALSDEKIKKYAGVSIKAKNVAHNPRPVSLEDEMGIFKRSCIYAD